MKTWVVFAMKCDEDDPPWVVAVCLSEEGAVKAIEEYKAENARLYQLGRELCRMRRIILGEESGELPELPESEGILTMEPPKLPGNRNPCHELCCWAEEFEAKA